MEEDVTYRPSASSVGPDLFTQAKLNDLTRDLALSKESAQLLASRLREKNLLGPDVTFYWYRHREQEFLGHSEYDDMNSGLQLSIT